MAILSNYIAFYNYGVGIFIYKNILKVQKQLIWTFKILIKELLFRHQIGFKKLAIHTGNIF